MCATFLLRRFEAYSRASVTFPGRWWPFAMDGPASKGEEMRVLKHGEDDMLAACSDSLGA